MYQNLAQNLIEMLILPRMDEKYARRYLKVENIDLLKKAACEPHGAILLTAHYGNWELSSIASALYGHPLKVLVREQGMPRLNALLNSYRQKKGNKVVSKGMAIRELIHSLRSKELIGMLSDQDAGREGALIPFFGRLASTHKGAFLLAYKTGCQIYPAFIIRKKGPHHRIILHPPLRLEGILEKDLEKFVKLLEGYIRSHPEQWLWLHKRWKSSPEKKICILSDGKAGHLNQSLAIAKLIRQANWLKQQHRQELRSRELTTIELIEVRFKNRFSRAILDLCSLIFPLKSWAWLGIMRSCVDSKTFNKLNTCYGDIVISCGASLSSLNIFFSQENFAKSIHLMKPNLHRARFNLIIAPAHDFLQGKNVLSLLAVPHEIDERLLCDAAGELRKNLQMRKNLCLGIILGGESKDYSLPQEILQSVVSEAKKIALALDTEILLTTSRRTNRDIEVKVKEGLGSFDRCRMLLIANEKNIPQAVAAILGLCQIIVVSGESTSMVSEAVASGKYVFVFKLKNKQAGKTKQDVFLEQLAQANYLRIVEGRNLFEEVLATWRSQPEIKKLDESQRILNAVSRLI
jgi:KDO2-lipid IV(A) lauroyltransferase